MINRPTLLADLKTLLGRLEADLLSRSESDEVPEVGVRLREEYERAKKAQRTAQNYEDWRTATITQAAAGWVLSCVFVRFLEDNLLIDPPKISGPTRVVSGRGGAVSGQQSAVSKMQEADSCSLNADRYHSRLQQARDEWELYLGKAKQPNERDYLVSVFDEVAALPGGQDVFGEHNPVRELPNWLSGDGARALLAFFQKIDADTGTLIHDFTDPQWNTRFLGDLYQDLSEAARKRYALLQTPEFVEEFILDRTLEPALEEFGLDGKRSAISNQRSAGERLNADKLTAESFFKMIDPACGSGHFLLGAFRRILDRWRKKEPGAPVRELVGRALTSIHGVDLNPYAVAIARFRLLLAAMAECGVTRLADCPAFKLNLACGDALLHGEGAPGTFGFDEYDHVYRVEDREELTRILRPGRYHAVAANPPYITPKDKAVNELYRKRYSTCHRQYALTVPFMQRLFQLAVSGYSTAGHGGYVGQITSNSFMKREFGKKLIEQYLAGHDGGPSVDLTHVIDTSGAYIPGHGTPTVILFGRNQPAVVKTIRTVMGIRGEPSTPADPARGLVWSAIVDQIDRPGSQSEFVSVADSPRSLFCKHPWSIGGGGAAELKELLEQNAGSTLDDIVETINAGICITREDDAYLLHIATLSRRRIEPAFCVVSVQGEHVRDWQLCNAGTALFPYDDELNPIDSQRGMMVHRFLWPYKELLWRRRELGGDHRELGRTWWEWNRFLSHRFVVPLSITYGEVATHNHFVLDRGGKVFNRTAPVIKLPPEATEDDHLALLGLLNSSTACFWMKQVCFPKGGDHVGQEGARVRRSLWDERYAFNATNLQAFPLPAGRPLALARQLDEMAGLLAELSPGNLLRAGPAEHNAQMLAERRFQWEAVRGQMIALQEELDWECYGLYGLLGGAISDQQSAVSKMEEAESCSLNAESCPAIALGERAFEIVLARRMARGEVQSTWFTRHGSTPRTELPDHWHAEYRRLVERRIERIETDRQIGLIEQPEYKRRWNTEPWDAQLQRALREWLLDRLESYFDFDRRMRESGQEEAVSNQRSAVSNKKAESRSLIAESSTTTVARLADVAGRDPEFMEVGELYRDDKAFDVQRMVEELVTAESVPLLPALRYKPSGLRKRAEWEKTWELQREEDQRGKGAEGQSEEHSGPLPLSHSAPLLDIPVPPKYTSADFLGSNYWRLRGKLDVPKERWVSFPHCEATDGTPVIAWAGYDHLQLARAISAYFVEVQERLGGHDDPRLPPLLGCLLELMPWLKQWHNEPDAAFEGMRMGDYFEGFVQDEARKLGKTIPEIRAWEPPKKSGGRKRRAKST